MIVNGNEIAAALKREISAKIVTFESPPSLAIFYNEEDTIGSMYVGRKEAFAKDIGVKVEKIPFLADETTEQAATRVAQKSLNVDGIVIQLPLPSQMEVEAVLGAITPEDDVDLVSASGMKFFEVGHTPLLPPVLGAIKLIMDQHKVKLEGAHAVVVGEGRLVGKPAAIWLRKKGVGVIVAADPSADLSTMVKNADIIVLGAGSPNILRPDMIKEGVSIFDAGTSIVEGKVHGDADPACAEKAFIFTPTPGGIGPLAIACAFQNLLHLAEEGRKNARMGKKS